MTASLEGCIFTIWGRFQGTTQAAVAQQVVDAGGTVDRDLQLATHLLCDQLNLRKQEAQAFEKAGGKLVTREWLYRQINTGAAGMQATGAGASASASTNTSASTSKRGKGHAQDVLAAAASVSGVPVSSTSTTSMAPSSSGTTKTSAKPRAQASTLRPAASILQGSSIGPASTSKKRSASSFVNARTATSPGRSSQSRSRSSSPLAARSTSTQRAVSIRAPSPMPVPPQRKKRKTCVVQDTLPLVSARPSGSLSPVLADDVVAADDEEDAAVPAEDCIVPLDDQYPGTLRDSVLIDEGGIWDAMLNQTDIASNKNKYYAIQLIKRDTVFEHYNVFSRWGRVGIRGQSQLTGFSNLDDAKLHFRRKFKEKTRIDWDDRDKASDMQAANKYAFISREYKRKPETVPVNSQSKSTGTGKTTPSRPKSKLKPALQSLLTLLFDVDRMEEEMREQGVNIQELPLGRLTKAQIRKGFAVLSEISDEIARAMPDHETLLALSSRFYTLIPHRAKNNNRPEVLKTRELVRAKLTLLQSLDALRVGTDLLEADPAASAMQAPIHRLDANYEKLKCQVDPLAATDIRYKMIEQYVDLTHNQVMPDWGASHKIQVDAIFTLKSELDDRFTPFAKEPNRQLLWHCSRIGNFTGILSKGLRIAPKEAPSSGFRLGKGIYFTNTLQKAQQYCYASSYPSDQCMLLCEVALGESQRRLYDDYAASTLAPGKDSTWGVGMTQHDREGHVTMEDGVLVPMGKSCMATEFGELECSAFTWNELVVYDVARVRPRFLLKTTFVKV